MDSSDLRSLPENEPVLCIPRVYPNISEGRIRHIFDELNLGAIDHIDFVKKENDQGQIFNMVFIHFRYWKNNRNANEARDRLLEGKQIKVIYDEPWFWKISAYKQPTRKSRKSGRNERKRPTLELDFEDSDDELRRPSKHYGKYKPHNKKTNHREYDIHHEVERSEREKKDDEEFGFINHQQDKDKHVEDIKDLDWGELPAKPKIKKSTLKYIPRQVKQEQTEINIS